MRMLGAVRGALRYVGFSIFPRVQMFHEGLYIQKCFLLRMPQWLWYNHKYPSPNVLPIAVLLNF